MVLGEIEGLTGACEECGLCEEGLYGKDVRHEQALHEEIRRLKRHVADLQSGMYVNCVYCGHRYGPSDSTEVTQADALKRHVANCPEHPLARVLDAVSTSEIELQRLLTRWDDLTPRVLKFLLEVLRDRMRVQLRMRTKQNPFMPPAQGSTER